MTDPNQVTDADNIFRGAERYDRSINWSARLARELPVLTDVFSAPGEGGIIDAGCGTGRQARAMAERGYRVIGADAGEEMIDLARRMTGADPQGVEFVLVPYARMHERLGGGHDGVYCLGNSLAAAGTRDEVAQAIDQFARCLRPGGRLFLQVVNFAAMRGERPCVRGPRVAVVDGREYVSVRHFSFVEDHVAVTNITLWQDDGWHKHTHSGRLYPVELEELQSLSARSGLRIDQTWGSYAREPFNPESSADLLIVATRL